jgi:hypothetical protein
VVAGPLHSCDGFIAPAELLLPCCCFCAYRGALLSSVDPVPSLATLLVTGGRLNVARALAALLGTSAPTPPPPTYCEGQLPSPGLLQKLLWCSGWLCWARVQGLLGLSVLGQPPTYLNWPRSTPLVACHLLRLPLMRLVQIAGWKRATHHTRCRSALLLMSTITEPPKTASPGAGL